MCNTPPCPTGGGWPRNDPPPSPLELHLKVCCSYEVTIEQTSSSPQATLEIFLALLYLTCARNVKYRANFLDQRLIQDLVRNFQSKRRKISLAQEFLRLEFRRTLSRISSIGLVPNSTNLDTDSLNQVKREGLHAPASENK